MIFDVRYRMSDMRYAMSDFRLLILNSLRNFYILYLLLPYLKIVITGPESTGKTTLCKQLAAHFNSPFLREYARIYLESLGRAYEKEDLLKIAQKQLLLEERLKEKPTGLLFLDTSFLVLKIWSEYKYQECLPFIAHHFNHRHYDHYFLCGIDVPWEDDPLRENQNERSDLYAIYKQQLVNNKLDFTALTGNQATRLSKAIEVVEELQKKHKK